MQLLIRYLIDGEPITAYSDDINAPSDDDFEPATELDDVARGNLDKLRLTGVPLTMAGPIEPDCVRAECWMSCTLCNSHPTYSGR